VPETRYAQSDEVSIAYQAFGSGPRDLVMVSTFWNQIEHLWELPAARRFLDRLGSFARVILLDKRGSGLSDRMRGAPTVEERMEDIRAVMDAAGSERAVLLGASEGGTLCAVFAAAHPERTTHLILYATTARWSPAPDFPWGPLTGENATLFDEYARTAWGSGALAGIIAPEAADDEQFVRWFGRLERLTASPREASELWHWNAEIDVRAALPAIRVPTLVLHRRDDPACPPEAGRHLAEHIQGARFVELSGGAHYPYVGDSDAVIDEIEEFVTGQRSAREPDRVLATVLFTDIVGSTERATALGDSRWRDLLGRHDELVRSQIERFRGREVKSMGDGFLATFDGPARGIRCARSIAEEVRDLGMEVRAGLHTGEVELVGDDVAGVAVSIGARVGAAAGPGEVLVSSTVKDLVVGSGIDFADRGVHDLKGVPGQWRLFAVAG
jgi:pimeloyl-ACP methyl ester carboxylesterase